MNHSFPISFDARRLNRVHFAIEPLDVFSGRVVGQHIETWLTDRAEARETLPIRAARNSKGHFVFVDLIGGPTYFVHVRGSRAGYLDPEVLQITPPPPVPDDAAADDPLWRVNRLFQVPLVPAPSFRFSPETTLIRGRVVRTGRNGDRRHAVERARVWLDQSPSVRAAAPPFTTLTDLTGSFALPVRLPPVVGPESPEPVQMTLHIRDEDPFGSPPRPLERTLTVTLRDGETHTFRSTIDLTGTGAVPFVQ